MTIIYADAETFFDRKEYSLSKMTTPAYVRDPRFKLLGMTIAVDDGPQSFLSEEEFVMWGKSIDWANATLVAFNAPFDALIFVERYGFVPGRYCCTLGMARALLPLDSHSLKHVSHALGIGEKGDALVSGSDVVSTALVDYALNDNELNRTIYKLLLPYLPAQELDLLSLTVKWAVEGRLELDAKLLEQSLQAEIAGREKAIADSGLSETVLSSNPKFVMALHELGVVAPTKISAATMEEAPALARGDAEFVELMASRPDLKYIWEGRLAAKSTMLIKRAEKFLELARTPQGTLPMPLNYYGARTGRWSGGGGGLNVQNLTRGSYLRKAIMAPKGKVIVVADLSQIELRLNLWLCGQTDKLAILEQGGDIYKQEAATQFNIPIEAVTKDQRQFGKLIQLSCGYGQGHVKFKKLCASGPMGMPPIHLTDEESYTAIQRYRGAHPKLTQMWREFGVYLPQMTLPSCSIPHGPVRFVHEGIELPNGMSIQYAGLRPNEQENWEYGMDKNTYHIYPGKIAENICQALARIVIAEQVLEIEKRYETVGSVHDEVLYLAPESEAEEALQFGLDVMSKSPVWAPDLPLSADGGWARNYSK